MSFKQVLLQGLLILSFFNLEAQLIKPQPRSITSGFPSTLISKESSINKISFSKLNALKTLNNRLNKKAGIATCNTTTFNLQLAPSAGQKIELKELQTLPAGSFLLAANVLVNNSSSEGLLLQVDNAGNIVSQTQLRVNDKPVTLYDTKVFQDGTIVITGIVHDATDKVFVSSLAPDLSVKWLEVFSTSSLPDKVTISLINDNNIALGVQLPDAIWFVGWLKMALLGGKNRFLCRDWMLL